MIICEATEPWTGWWACPLWLQATWLYTLYRILPMVWVFVKHFRGGMGSAFMITPCAKLHTPLQDKDSCKELSILYRHSQSQSGSISTSPYSISSFIIFAIAKCYMSNNPINNGTCILKPIFSNSDHYIMQHNLNIKLTSAENQIIK